MVWHRGFEGFEAIGSDKINREGAARGNKAQNEARLYKQGDGDGWIEVRDGMEMVWTWRYSRDGNSSAGTGSGRQRRQIAIHPTCHGSYRRAPSQAQKRQYRAAALTVGCCIQRMSTPETALM